MSGFNPLAYEPEILKFWEDRKTHLLASQRNRGKKPFYFLDGPPYTSGKVHIGTAWNKSLKDSILRYKRMQGFEVLDRAGYDMHGLPTENAAEKKLGIRSKDDIAKFGVDGFVKACKELSIENMRVMNEDFRRLGVWMDFDNAYQSVTREFIDGEWWLVKQAHEKGRLYEGMRSMAWDWAHQTALAKHELEYKMVSDPSIFVKMKAAGKEDEYFIVWTTTPWTIPFNLGIMVHPDIEYVRCKVEGETWIVAKALAGVFIGSVAGKQFTVLEEFRGERLKGAGYVHPFHDELKEHYEGIKRQHPNAHTVVLTEEYVDTSSGTGLVHMAPGCGPEDYEVGYRNNLPAWNTVREDGHFGEGMGKFTGRHAIRDNKAFIEDLDGCGALIARTQVEHQYPFGQRSNQPVIFRTTKQWFFRVEDIKRQMIAENDKVQWVPKAGYNAFNSWLENLRDNSISKQRYWGTPLPVWRNTEDPDDYLVVGSVGELEQLSGMKVEEPHIPWIDDIVIRKGAKAYKRVPDVLDVWVDAGCASWNSLDFPHRKDLFDRYFPADFILEGKDQVRGWFNLLHVASMVALGRPSFKAAYMHGFVQDALGRKMSKSLGNYITPEEVVSKYGADTLRYYMISGTSAGVDINYNFDDMKVKHKNLMVLWNIHRYVLDLARQSGFNPTEAGGMEGYEYDLEEHYIISKLHSSIRKATKLYDEYRLDEVPAVVEHLFLELSRTYLQLTREKASGSEDEKKLVCGVACTVLMESLRLFAPVAPFITEKLYQNLKHAFNLEEESIHLCHWPAHNESRINKDLEEQMEAAAQLVQAALGAREKMQRGVRWPLREMIVVTQDGKTVEAVEALRDSIQKQVNVKSISIQQSLPGIRQSVRPDFNNLGPDFGKDAAKVIAHLATSSPETILSHIEREGKYALKVEDKTFNIVREHLIVTRDIPGKYVEAAFRNGFLYLDKDLTDELEAEGYAREATRRIQALRKKSGLEKHQQIVLFIKVDGELKAMLGRWEAQIRDKVGASVIKISELDPAKQHQHMSQEKIRGKGMALFFDVL
ncbi:TPA: isoleucine--tRNA ligase [Candidatus Woesearchaeota archaeon]|nr:isoleucine--tRNA ligase [Candidatus Woesearchaeota archaeon]